jgi:hypothetical protein
MKRKYLRFSGEQSTSISTAATHPHIVYDLEFAITSISTAEPYRKSAHKPIRFCVYRSILKHLHRCGFFSSKLNSRFGIDETFSNGPFPKSKVWIWTKILSRVRHFGQISCPNCSLGELLDELVSRKTSPFALISDGVCTLGVAARNCAACRPPTTTTAPNPSLARRRKHPRRFTHAAPCALDCSCHVWRAGRLAPRLERAALTRAWGATRCFPFVCKRLRIYSSSVRMTVSFRRWCAACRTVAQTRHR